MEKNELDKIIKEVEKVIFHCRKFSKYSKFLGKRFSIINNG